jgi:hypothetical protein
LSGGDALSDSTVYAAAGGDDFPSSTEVATADCGGSDGGPGSEPSDGGFAWA